MTTLTLKPLDGVDLDEIVLAFKNIGWHKPKSLYETYLEEQASGLRSVIIAKDNDKFCGYVTIKWNSDYVSFKMQNIPEIADLNVLPEKRGKGIGTLLIQACEQLIISKGLMLVGLGVGLTADYGNAQRLYTHLGFVVDGNGIHYKNRPVKHFESVSADDDLVLYLTKNLTSL